MHHGMRNSWTTTTITVLLLFLLQLLLQIDLINSNLIVSLVSRNNDSQNPIKVISYCIDCPSPEHEGSIAYALNAKHGINIFRVTAELVYCIPNHAEAQHIFNSEQLYNRIALVDRGIVSLQEKALKLHAAGVAGIIIADDGQCNQAFTFCGPVAGSIAEGGFAANDEDKVWKSLQIPVLLVTIPTAEKLRSMMVMKRINILQMGSHNATILAGYEEDEL